MSGEVHELEPLPESAPAVLRQFQQRLRRLESSKGALRVGDWVITSKDGALIASKPGADAVALTDIDETGAPVASSARLPAIMPDEWWSPIIRAITGFEGTLDDLGQYLDAQYYASTHGPGALLAGANMLWNPDFTGIESLAGGDDWEWDHSVYFQSSGSGAAADQGSAKTVCNGKRKVLRSNLVQVSEGQVLQLSARVGASGLTGDGVSLGVAVYGSDGSRQEFVIKANMVPVDLPTNWYGLPVGAKAAVVSGSWKVPAGVTAVRQYVDTSAPAGALWVDRGSFELGGLLSLLTRQLLWDDVGVLTRTAVTYVFGDTAAVPAVLPFSKPATEAMAAAFKQVLDDLGLTGPPDKDMKQFWQAIWDGAIAAVVPKALLDVPGFFDAGWKLAVSVFNYLLGLNGYRAFSDEATAQFKLRLNAFLAYLFPAGVTIPTVDEFWRKITGNVLQQFIPTLDSGLSELGEAFDKMLHPNGPGVPGWLTASTVVNLAGRSVTTGNLYYVVTAVKDGVESSPSNEAWVLVLLPLTQVSLTWTAVEGATSYRVYRGSKSRGWDRLVGTTTQTKFDDSGLSTTAGTPPSAAARAGTAVGTIVNGVYGQDTVPTGEPPLSSRITQTEVNQKNAQNFQISALTGGYRNPIWACRYPVVMCPIPNR